MQVLEAEWSYLNDPVRLADLARRHYRPYPGDGEPDRDLATACRRAPLRRRMRHPALPPMRCQYARGSETAPCRAMPVVAESVAAPARAGANDPVFRTSARRGCGDPA